MIRVVAYTNAAKARLELNGTVVGPTKDYDQKTGIIYWDIPYAAGKLELVGMDTKGKETIRHQLQSRNVRTQSKYSKANSYRLKQTG